MAISLLMPTQVMSQETNDNHEESYRFLVMSDEQLEENVIGNHEKDYSFIHYSFPFVILQSLCLFALFKNQKGLEKFDKVLT